jgi:hypothetical protein
VPLSVLFAHDLILTIVVGGRGRMASRNRCVWGGGMVVRDATFYPGGCEAMLGLQIHLVAGPANIRFLFV